MVLRWNISFSNMMNFGKLRSLTRKEIVSCGMSFIWTV